MAAIASFPKRGFRPEPVAAQASHADILQLLGPNRRLLRVDFGEAGIAAGVAGRARCLQAGVLVMHRVAGFEMSRQGNCRWNLELWLWSHLLRKNTFLS